MQEKDRVEGILWGCWASKGSGGGMQKTERSVWLSQLSLCTLGDPHGFLAFPRHLALNLTKSAGVYSPWSQGRLKTHHPKEQSLWERPMMTAERTSDPLRISRPSSAQNSMWGNSCTAKTGLSWRKWMWQAAQPTRDNVQLCQAPPVWTWVNFLNLSEPFWTWVNISELRIPSLVSKGVMWHDMYAEVMYCNHWHPTGTTFTIALLPHYLWLLKVPQTALGVVV